MPVHAVVAHLAVVVAPLTAFVALAYALLPASRRGMRWPLVAGSVLSLGVVVWAAIEGDTLFKALTAGAASHGTTLPATVGAHAHGSDLLTATVAGLAVVVLTLVWWLLRPGRTSTPATKVAAGVLALTAAGTLYATVIVLQQAITAVWSLHPYWK